MAMYNTVKNARRAARKQGLAEGTFEITEQDGGYVIVPHNAANENVEQPGGETPTSELPIVDQPSPEQGAAELPTEAEERERLEKETAGDPETPEAPAPVATGDVPDAFGGEGEKPADPEPAAAVAVVTPTEVIAIVMPTEAKTPFAFIWDFLAKNPNVPRKAQIAAMIATGLNANTVKTQVSRFYKVGGDKALWLASEKLKRDAEKARIEELVAKIKADKAAAEQAAAEAKAKAEAPSE